MKKIILLLKLAPSTQKWRRFIIDEDHVHVYTSETLNKFKSHQMKYRNC